MPTFTDRELDLMAVLWRDGSATVAEMQEALADKLAYTTVLTVLRVLENKGYVRHEEEGRAYRYFPSVARERAGRRALRRIRETIFDGSPDLLLTNLMSDREITEEDVRRMRALLDRRLKEMGK